MDKTDLLRLYPSELEELAVSFGEPAYRGRQISDWLFKGTGPDGMSNLPSAFREKLKNGTVFKLPSTERKLVSASDGTVKYLFRLFDGETVESVVMRYKHGLSICISTEVGCPMGCRFCASTIGGKVRDLSASEMVGQVIVASNDIGERISNVVMMGIGEPLDNYEESVRFLRLANQKNGLNIGYRHISLSTCGIVPMIYRLAGEELPVTLSISLHAPDNERRSEIMPVNRRYPLEELMTACRDYFEKSGRRISFEYTLIDGFNDSSPDARLLASLFGKYFSEGGKMYPVNVNLIPVNNVKDKPFRRSNAADAERFKNELIKLGINATLRRHLGADINASCGQLRRESQQDRAE